MEIIDELEPTVRGIYTGAIGYIDFEGNADFNIPIRTAVVNDGAIHYQSGGGIVADSDPEKEYEETLLKAKAFFDAMDLNRKAGAVVKEIRNPVF
jgi:para-aminobenzoate synthetase component 1